MLSFLFYLAAVIGVVAAIALVRPIRWIRLGTRQRAFYAGLAALTFIVIALAWPAGDMRVTVPASRLDAIVPVYQFSESHETTVDASAEATYRAICAVTPREIAFLGTLTWIRRMGRSGPESVLNPPADAPFCDVALKSGFYKLADDPGRELVLGTFVAAPRAARTNVPVGITAATFASIHSPGFAIAVMNFHLDPIGPTRTRLTTETRVYATDARTRRLFAAYWRVIYPGSAIIRSSWLRAIRRRAEAP